MLLLEHFPHLADDWTVSVIATDLAPHVLTQAKEGCYSQFEVNRGLPAIYLAKYFTQRGDNWHVNDEVKRRIQFHHLNLVQSWPPMHLFDLVFLRNVMIYFDLQTKKRF